LPINPTTGLDMPADLGRRDRIVSPEQAVTLLGVLSDQDRPLWATAMYAGLRCGELRGLRWDDVEFLDGVIHVRRGWDDVEGEIAPKSRAAIRRVPMPTILRGHLEALYARAHDPVLAFGKDGQPFDRGESPSASAQRLHGRSGALTDSAYTTAGTPTPHS
jgi:integrase